MDAAAKLGDKRLVRVFAKHDPYWDTMHVSAVIEYMRAAGTPTIRVVEYHGDYYATEGSHRLYAAHMLGLVPKWVIEPPDRTDPTDEAFLEIVKSRLPHYTWMEE